MTDVIACMNNNECLFKESNINSGVELCNIIEADEERPRFSLTALWKALICRVIVVRFFLLDSCFGMLLRGVNSSGNKAQ